MVLSLVSIRPRLVVSSVLGVVLLAVSLVWLRSLVGAEVDSSDRYPPLSPTKTVSISISCPRILFIIGFNLLLGDDSRGVSASILGGAIPPEIQTCTDLTLQTTDLDYKSIDVWHNLGPGEYDSPWSEQPSFSMAPQGGGTSNYRFTKIDLSQFPSGGYSIVIGIRPSDTLTQTSSELWVADIRYRIRFSCLDCESEEDLENRSVSNNVKIGSSLSLASISPTPSVSSGYKTAENGENIPILTYSFSDDEVASVEYEDGQYDYVSELRTTTTLRDDSYQRTETMQLIIASTIFGAAISILIEAFLSLELYRLLRRED